MQGGYSTGPRPRSAHQYPVAPVGRMASAGGGRSEGPRGVSVVGGGGQLYEPVVGGEQPPDQAQGDYRGGGGGGGEHQEHDDGLDQDGLQGSGTGEDEAGHGPGQEDQAGGLGGFDLRGE